MGERSVGDAGRGREAERPSELGRHGWRDVALRVKHEVGEDHISIVAAGVAYYALFAIIPALAAVVSVFGLLTDPNGVRHLIGGLAGTIPAEAQQLLLSQLGSIAARSSTALSVGVVGSLLLTLWSASQGTKALMTALNIVYEEEERRGFFRRSGVALLLTVGALLFAVLTLALVVALPALIGRLGLPGWLSTTLALARWPILLVAVMVGLAVLYRYAPSRQEPKWRWVSWGSVVATVLWLIGSALFSFYVSHFGSYNKTYGSIGAVVILLLWFYLSAFVVLLGAELNSEMEHQTRRDTTSGSPAPMGERGATMADTLGTSPGH